MASDNQESTGQGPSFTVHNIYLKDCSYEAPNTPQIFGEEWKPKLDFDLEMASGQLAEGVYEVVMHVTVTVKLGEDKDEKVTFLVEIKQAGVFSVQGFTEDQLQHLLATTCPGVLYPYARETVSNMVTRGGFPQLVLPPMNFEAMYQKRLAEMQQSEKKGSGTNG